MHARYVEGLDLKNDALRNMVERQGELMELLVDSEAENLARRHNGEEVDNEQMGRVKLAIKEFAKLIEKGAQIHPSLQASESVKNLFPDFKKLLLLESATKLIEENAGADVADSGARR